MKKLFSILPMIYLVILLTNCSKEDSIDNYYHFKITNFKIYKVNPNYNLDTFRFFYSIYFGSFEGNTRLAKYDINDTTGLYRDVNNNKCWSLLTKDNAFTLQNDTISVDFNFNEIKVNKSEKLIGMYIKFYGYSVNNPNIIIYTQIGGWYPNPPYSDNKTIVESNINSNIIGDKEMIHFSYNITCK